MKALRSLLLLTLLSCGRSTAVPEDVLPVAKMTAVLWDVMLADALATQRYPVDTTKRFDTSVILYAQIAKAHGTTQIELQKSLRFYESRPDLLQPILDSLQKHGSIPAQANKKDTTKTIKKILKRPTNPLRAIP